MKPDRSCWRPSNAAPLRPPPPPKSTPGITGPRTPPETAVGALVPEGEASRLWANGLQLTLTDFVAEIHDTHHPIGASLYYEDQQEEAKRRSVVFVQERLPKFLYYFERVLSANAGNEPYLVGTAHSYVDLSLFQVVTGLRYAFPRSMERLEPEVPEVTALADRVSQRPKLAAYLTSDRRLDFNESGIFRHYPELDT